MCPLALLSYLHRRLASASPTSSSSRAISAKSSPPLKGTARFLPKISPLCSFSWPSLSVTGELQHRLHSVHRAQLQPNTQRPSMDNRRSLHAAAVSIVLTAAPKKSCALWPLCGRSQPRGHGRRACSRHGDHERQSSQHRSRQLGRYTDYCTNVSTCLLCRLPECRA